MKKSIRVMLATAAAVALGTVAGCGGSAQSSSDSAGSKVKVAVIPSLSAMPLFVADKKGFFKDEGLDVTLTESEGGPAAMQAMLSGAVQVAHAGVIPFLNVAAKDVPVSAFASTAIKGAGDNTNRLFVRKGSDITSVKQLAGKKVAINQQGNFEQFVMDSYMLPKNGVDSSKVDFIEIPYPNMQAAIDKKQVDAVIADEPITSKLAADSNLVSIDSGANYLPDIQMPTSAQVSKTPFANSPEAAKYTKVLTKALTWAKKNRAETTTIVADATGLPADVVKKALADVQYPDSASIDPDAWNAEVQALTKVDFLAKAPELSQNLVVVK